MYQLLQPLFSKTEGRKQRRVEARSLENPNISLADTQYWDMFGAGAESITVNQRTALSNTAQWASVGRRARTIASLSWKVYKNTELGSEPDTSHPLYRLLNRAPNPLYNAFTFWQTIVTNLDTTGRAYAHIIRRQGVPYRLDLIQPSQVRDLQATNSGNYFFIVEKAGLLGHQQRQTIPLADMLWFKGLTFDGIDCLDPSQVHKDTLGAGMAASKYANSFYENGAHINYAIESPLELSPTARKNITSEWGRLFAGMRNAFKRPFFADKGMKLHPLKMTPADAALNESKKQTTEEIARINDIPAHMVGGGERFTFSSIEMMQLDFVQYSLRNTVRQMEIELENKLLTTEELNTESHHISANLDGLLRGDTKSRSEKLINEVKWGLISKNEYRRLQGLNEVEGGDVVFNPVNMFVTPQGETPVNPIQTETNGEPEE